MKQCILVGLGILFMVFGCSAPKDIRVYGKQLKQGKVAQKDFKKSVSYEYRRGLIVVPAKINGKTYDFILDTGASNVISKELQQEIQLKVIGSQPIAGADGRAKDQKIVAIEDIGIAGLQFQNTIAAVVDLNAVTALKSLNVDGIIGANLMRKAIWDFDFPNQTITITDSEKKLKLPKEYRKSRFFIGYQGGPYVTSYVNGTKLWSTLIDTGFNGSIVLQKSHFKQVQQKESIDEFVKGKGIGSIGVYGAGAMDTLYLARIKNFKFGTIALERTMISFEGQKGRRIGMEFMKNYRMIINWKSKQVKFIGSHIYDNNTFSSFGIKCIVDENVLKIVSLYDGSSAVEQGLQIGDEILRVNNKSLEALDERDKSKEFWEIISNKEVKKLDITYRRNEEIKKAHVELKELL